MMVRIAKLLACRTDKGNDKYHCWLIESNRYPLILLSICNLIMIRKTGWIHLGWVSNLLVIIPL